MKQQYMQQEEKDLIIKLHLEGKFTTEISKIVGRGQTTIERFLKREGYSMNNKSRLSENDKMFIKDMYQNGMTCADIYRTYFKEVYKSSAVIERYIRKCGLSRGKYVKPATVNHNYFETIDCERKAYWLGMLMADGSIVYRSENSKVVSLHLNTNDKYIVEEFAKDIETDLTVKDYTYDYGDRKVKHDSILRIHSVKMANDLAKYNIIPRKSYKEFGLPNIKSEYMSHFIRGLFDGDGSISLIKPKDQYIHRANVTFCGNKQLVNELYKFFKENLDMEGFIVDMNKYGNNIFNFRLRTNDQIFKLREYMYNNATIYMKRKREKFDKFVEERM